jgi:hypothetical protein
MENDEMIFTGLHNATGKSYLLKTVARIKDGFISVQGSASPDPVLGVAVSGDGLFLTFPCNSSSYTAQSGWRVVFGDCGKEELVK